MSAGGWGVFHPGAGLASAHLASANLAGATKVGQLSVPSSWFGSAGAAEQGATKVMSTNFVNAERALRRPTNAALGGAPMAGRAGLNAPATWVSGMDSATACSPAHRRQDDAMPAAMMQPDHRTEVKVADK